MGKRKWSEAWPNAIGGLVEIELDIQLVPAEDGTAVLTVSGPIDGVILAYGLVRQGLSMFSPDDEDGPLGDSSVG